jgi:hypothetical protein
MFGQKNMIQEIFSQDVFREDFKESSLLFPTEQIADKFSILLEKEDVYFVGTEKSNYTVMINWENDLVDFELKSLIKMAPEDKINIFPTQTPQVAGIIIKYNPDTQEGLIFEINSVKKYRLVYIKDSKNRNLTYSNDDGWIKSENLRKNERNEIRIKTKDHKLEFYINGEFEFKSDLNKKRIDPLSTGRFGFHIGSQTKIKIDYLYISTTKDYNGINKLLKLSEKEINQILTENDELKEKVKSNETKEIEDLKKVIQLVENQLRTLHVINDSLQQKNNEFAPFIELMGGNKDFIHTLSRELKNEITKNLLLKDEHETLKDSIETLNKNQEIFRLEYLKALDSMITNNKQDTIKK